MPGGRSRTRTDHRKISTRSKNRCPGGSRSVASWKTIGTRSIWIMFSQRTTSQRRICRNCSRKRMRGSSSRRLKHDDKDEMEMEMEKEMEILLVYNLVVMIINNSRGGSVGVTSILHLLLFVLRRCIHPCTYG